MNKFILRASQAKDFLLKGRTKSEIFGSTAISVIKDQALQAVFGYTPCETSKYTQKGIMMEQISIDLLNNLFFESYVKNSQRITDDFFTGECDINAQDCIRDIKTQWSLATMPFTELEIEKKVMDSGYYAQAQVYMYLYDKPKAYIDFILVPTPLELLRYSSEIERDMLHNLILQIPATQRHKSYEIERDSSIIDELKERIELAQPIFLEFVKAMQS